MLTKLNQKIIVTSNLDRATNQQKEAFYKNLSEAMSVLYKSVIKRKMQELMKE